MYLVNSFYCIFLGLNCIWSRMYLKLSHNLYSPRVTRGMKPEWEYWLGKLQSSRSLQVARLLYSVLWTFSVHYAIASTYAVCCWSWLSLHIRKKRGRNIKLCFPKMSKIWTALANARFLSSCFLCCPPYALGRQNHAHTIVWQFGLVHCNQIRH